MAEIVVVNGAVFLADAARGWATAVAVDGGRIVGVGGDEVVDEHVDGETEVIDAAGRLVTPGFQDAHVHPHHGGWTRARCDLDESHDADSALAQIAGHVTSSSEAWVQGGGWHFTWFPNGTPSAATLDRVVPDRPAAFKVADGHATWVNSPALQLAGIDSTTPDPSDGRIERNPDGTPQGTLHEGAMHLIEHVLPADTDDDTDQALLLGQDHLISLGITAWQDAWVEEDLHRSYLRLDADGRLVADVRAALWWDRMLGAEQIERIVEWRSQTIPGGRYRPGTVKLMLDGICENFTAAVLDGFLDSDGAPTNNHGIDMIDPLRLREYVTELDRLGFQCHFHAIGDAAVRNALDAVASARATNGDRGQRHHIAHIQIVDPDDLPRFRTLGVTANAQPLWACLEEAQTELTIPFLGDERSRHQYPFGSLLRHGATMAMGSDWPVSSANVLEQIAIAVTRVAPLHPDLGVWLPEERVTLSDALAAFTAGSAYVNHRSHRSGTVAVGYAADLVVLDGNPFDFPADGIAAIGVDKTMIGGQWI